MKKAYRTTSSNGLRLRNSPFDGETITILKNGARIQSIDEQTWVKVTTTDGLTGYVLKDFIEEDNTVSPQPDGIIEYRSEFGHIVSQAPIRIHQDFESHVLEMEACAREQGIKILVTSSLRSPNKPLKNAVVSPAQLSNHFVGHALDMNFLYEGRCYGSFSFKRRHTIPLPICRFIENVKSSRHMRWGGDFSNPDYIHFDDKFNLRQPDHYLEKLANLWGG